MTENITFPDYTVYLVFVSQLFFWFLNNISPFSVQLIVFWTSSGIFSGSYSTNFQGITGTEAKIVSVASGFDALDNANTVNTVENTLCGTGNGKF